MQWTLFSLSSCVLKWEDPHDSVVYCIDSDNKWMVISGTNRYGVVSHNITAVTLFVKVFVMYYNLFEIRSEVCKKNKIIVLN